MWEFYVPSFGIIASEIQLPKYMINAAWIPMKRKTSFKTMGNTLSS